jgi:hypothetical protein
MNRDTLALSFSIGAVIIAASGLVTVIAVDANRPRLAEPVAKVEVPKRPRVALDCNRPQGHHRWIADMIVPPTSAEDGTTVRLSVKDAQGNTDNTDIDIKGWLCVIDAEPGDR